MLKKLFLNFYSLYAITIFLSAFLLFQIQPLIGRHLLPWFGGASAVWATMLLFFTTMLFFGYAYSYYLSRLAYATQARIHIFVVAVGAAIVILYTVLFQSVYPPLDWTVGSSLSPISLVLLSLVVMIGIPYFLLSTTGPLLQYWFGVKEGREPYHLYIISNAGSFIALGTYPFVVEPLFTLGTQSGVWTTLFVLFATLYGFITYRFLRATRSQTLAERADNTRDDSVIPRSMRLLWVLYAALPAALMVATTTQLTQAVAPVPFLWIMPLALYLLTFIVAFRGWGGGGLNATLILLFAWFAFSMLGYEYDALTRQMLLYLTFFFVTGLYCHARLYTSRPEAPHATLFYLYVSLGGVVGTVAISIIAPLVFTDWFEFPIGIMTAAIAAIILFPAMRYIRDGYARHIVFIRAFALFVVAAVGMYHVRTLNDFYFYVSRNFYGVVKIYQDDEGGVRKLYHGTTLHGKQFTDPAKAIRPMTYYGPGSGVGRAMNYAATTHATKKAKKESGGLMVGTIGLGTGSLAAYCSGVDHFIFYEIDSRIEDVAREYFTYLSNCEHGEVRIGDGRKLLEAEKARGELQSFDVFAVDAFNDDTIPAHLLTREAVELYMGHLKDDKSILVIHTSNRYLDLAPVVIRIAHELGLTSLVVNDGGSENDDDGLTSSEWVVVVRDPSIFENVIFSDVEEYPQESAPLWTDDYMNVLAALDLPAIYTWDTE